MQKTSTASGDRQAVPAAARTLRLFEIFAAEKRELAKSEIAKFLSLPESSCSDLLNTLHNLGYVYRTPETRKYYPTLRLMACAKDIADHNPLVIVAQELTSAASDQTGETSTFGFIEDGEVKVVAIKEGWHALRYAGNFNDRHPVHATSLGKALSSSLSDEEIAAVVARPELTRFTKRTVDKVADFIADVRRQADQGWFMADEEGFEGVSAIAVLVPAGPRPTALSIAGPSGRMKAQLQTYLAALQEIAGRV